MGKASMCIQMLEFLNTGRVYKVSELASLLGTKSRNVIEYKRELEEAGYGIKSIAGRHGGYQLDKTYVFPSLKFTAEEKDAFSEGVGYISSRNDFMYQKPFLSAVSKVYSSLQRPSPEEEITVVNRFPLVMPVEELSKRYEALKSCLPPSRKERGRVVEITYLSSHNELSTRKIHPYKLFMFNNSWFVLAYDERREEVRYFKINRIEQYNVTNETFRVKLAYNESDFLDNFSMRQNGEFYTIKLKVTGNYAMLVQERVYGKNQSVECVDSDTTILTCDMQNKDNIVSFVLGFGSYCQVLEPTWLKEEVIKFCKNTIANLSE